MNIIHKSQRSILRKIIHTYVYIIYLVELIKDMDSYISVPLQKCLHYNKFYVNTYETDEITLNFSVSF